MSSGSDQGCGAHRRSGGNGGWTPIGFSKHDVFDFDFNHLIVIIIVIIILNVDVVLLNYTDIDKVYVDIPTHN